jgi:metal-responsive CopG/Arc/MetJ family transcriptional regulator
MPSALLREIEQIAQDEGRNRSEQIRFFLARSLARRSTDGREAR